MTTSLNKIIEMHMSTHKSFNLLSRKDNIRAIFSLVTLEDVNKFIADNLLTTFPSTTQLKVGEDGNVSQIIRTDVGHIHDLKNSVSLSLLQTNVA